MVLAFGLLKSGLFNESELTGEGLGGDVQQQVVQSVGNKTIAVLGGVVNNDTVTPTTALSALLTNHKNTSLYRVLVFGKNTSGTPYCKVRVQLVNGASSVNSKEINTTVNNGLLVWSANFFVVSDLGVSTLAHVSSGHGGDATDDSAPNFLGSEVVTIGGGGNYASLTGINVQFRTGTAGSNVRVTACVVEQVAGG